MAAPALPRFEPVDTPRLRVRPVCADDLADLLAVNGDDEVTRFLPYDTWRSHDDAQAWFERMQAQCADGQAHQLVIEHQGRAIGTVLLFRWEAPSARIELGYVLGRAHWGRGLAHEALAAVLAACFGALGQRRVEAQVQPENHASKRLLARLGFGCEGRLRQRWVAKGRAYDVELWGVLADGWRGAVADAAPRPADRFDHLFVEPASFDASVAFYRDGLGWSERFAWGEPGTPRGIGLDGGGVSIVLAERHDAADHSKSHGISGTRPTLHLAVDDLDARHAALAAKGLASFAPETTHWGVRWFVARDPDGNLIAFEQARRP